MRLDANILRYITKDELRVLTAIEMGMKNHQVVPIQLIEKIAKLKRGGTYKNIQSLLKMKLLVHENKQYEGYHLNYQGYDILALSVFAKRGVLTVIGSMIGTGKESDIYLCEDGEGRECVVKLARLGRMSFRAVKNKRDYLGNRSKHNWFYMSRLAAIKEFSFMTALHEAGLPTPIPISHNRHAILMTRLPAYPLINIRVIEHPEEVLQKCLELFVRLAELGLIHCDYNQFNLLVDDEEEVYVIDFPEMVSVNHLHAKELFDRDVECLNSFFSKKFGVECSERPVLDEIEVERNLDEEIRASGYAREVLEEEELEDMAEIENDDEFSEEEKELEEEEEDFSEEEDSSEKEGSEDGEMRSKKKKLPLKEYVARELKRKPKIHIKIKTRNKNKKFNNI